MKPCILGVAVYGHIDGSVLLSFNCSSLACGPFYMQRCLNTVDVVASLYGPATIHLRTRKSAGSPSFEDLSRTSHLRARCGPMYHQVLVFCITSAIF
jgi:hypothetical protein